AMGVFLQSYPRFTGLTGSREQIDHVKGAFRVFAQRKDDLTNKGGYVLPHTAITYLIDPQGKFVAHFTDALSAVEMTDRLRPLLETEKAARERTPTADDQERLHVVERSQGAAG